MTSGIRRVARRSRRVINRSTDRTAARRENHLTWNNNKTALCSDSRLKHLYRDGMLHALLGMQPAK